jgi:hypothetical protein
MYVGQLQDKLDARESEWWTKQLGHTPGEAPPAP